MILLVLLVSPMPSPVHSPEIVVEGEGHGEGLVGGRVWRDGWVGAR